MDKSSLPRGPIPILSNSQIRRFMDHGAIRITPFHPDQLAPTAYRLRPHSVRFQRKREENEIEVGTFPLSIRPYLLQPKEHVVVSIEEEIVIGKGLVGTFYPASGCVESGLVLTAGRLDADYRHAIVFGVLNASGKEATLDHDFQLARISFTWLGEDNQPEYSGDSPASYILHLDEKRKKESTL